MALRITFYGGAESVTGSNFLIEGEEGKILIDCGLEQGAGADEAAMHAPFPYDVPGIDALVITHAHLDHIGRAPKLMREGFTGKVYMTPPTRDLTELMLRDSARIMAMNAEDGGPRPLFDEGDIEVFLSRYEALPLHEEKTVAPGLSVHLRATGHILGSVSVRVRALDGTSVAVTGDIGNTPAAYLPDAEAIPDADAMVIESVYGDRTHDYKGKDRVDALARALKKAIERGGTILIPAFSIERSQLMLYEISNLMDAGEIPRIPVLLDSPLAISVTDVYEKWGSEYFKPEVEDELRREGSLFAFKGFAETPTREDSKAIDSLEGPKIILAGAGMSHGGRIGRHEALYLPDPSTTIFMVGYQAPGTPGRLLQDGAHSIYLNGKPVKVRATVESFSGWSAHADRDGLIEFAKGSLPRTHTFFVTLGEPSSARFLAQRIHGYLGRKAVVPVLGESWEVTKEGVKKLSKQA